VEPGETAKLRDDEIASYDVVGRPPAHDLQALAEVAAQLADAPGATIVLVTSNQEHRVAATGFGTLPTVPEPADRTAFSVPLVAGTGLDLGRLCIVDVDPGHLSDRQRDALEVLAGQVVRALELRSRSRRLDDLAAELTEARDELKRSHEHLTLFAGQVSHDLRTPLTAILANAEMLAGEPVISDAPDVAWMLDGITRAAHRLDTMIEQVLAYAAQGGEPQRTDTDLNAVFGSVLTDLAPTLEDSGAVVVVDPLPTVLADRHQLYAVALNLVSNAIRFASPGVRPEIRISSERYADRWRISVTDNGIGIPEERREAMFVLFARADKRSGGSGIGLAATRRAVEAHGGRVGIDGPAGGGSTVWFDLPA
jgi:signal transduction histidine kinase